MLHHTSSPQQLAVYAAGAAPDAQLRTDVDPDALPPTPQFSDAQRRVLTACLQQFATRGYEASSTRDIAAAIGVQSPSLYRHFESKEAMLSALVVLGYEYYNGRLLRALVSAGPTSLEQLTAVIREHALISCEYARLTLVIQQQIPHLPPDVLATVMGYRARTVQLVEQVLQRGQDDGVFVVRHLRTTITTLGSIGISAALTFPSRPELSAEQYADEFVLLALRLVGATTVPSHEGDR